MTLDHEAHRATLIQCIDVVAAGSVRDASAQSLAALTELAAARAAVETAVVDERTPEPVL